MVAPVDFVKNRKGSTGQVSAPGPLPDEPAVLSRQADTRDKDRAFAQGVILALLLAGLFIWVYWGQAVRLWYLWQTPDWMHGFLIPIFSVYFVYMKRRELRSGEHRGSLAGLLVMAASLAVYIYFIYAKVGYPQALSMIPFIAGLVLLLRGWQTLRHTWFAIAFLALALPPPDRLYREITQPLQQVAAGVGVAILNLFPGASVERAGINIAFFMDDGRSGNFAVAGACSGMRSLMAFVALGLAMAFMTHRPTWHRLAIAMLVVPVALFCNFLRVVITGAAQMYGYADLASGTPHSLLGLAMFGLGMGIYLGLLWVLDNLFEPEPDGASREGAS